jgi:hypothetical protein
MSVKGWLAAASVMAMMTTVVGAQAKADFTGSWQANREKTMASSPQPAAGGSGRAAGTANGVASARMGGGGTMSPSGAPPQPYVLTQTATALTITRDLGDGSSQKWVYKLDGSDSVNVNGRTTLTSRSRWIAGKLVTEGKQVTVAGENTMEGTFKEVRWLDAEGSMHVETTRQIGSNAAGTTYLVLDKK